ncbi:metallophosphoesterase [Brucepastera parasyntrophica]|uniref:bifunctional metallophosphatase/5'-nucleotidase n=1 Tax=Brucepastera parasyntrophica TaxID=2880008 RepID=UPI00210A85DF|nr:metallophosphoesterase [Brucepastera parasyntrophica]ULQ58785.1 metallophosphoesterase [Brucepastera parasyntrophica]
MKRRFSVLISLLFAVVLFSGGCSSANDVDRVPGKTYPLVVLHTNDSHGTILPADGQGGLAERATYINTVRAENENVLLLDAGDINVGTAFSNFFNGDIDITAYNMMKYDAATFGNHEFDYTLKKIEDQMKLADFPFLSANIKRADGKYLGRPWIVKNYDGFRIGIFGLTTLRTLTIASPDKSLNFINELTAAEEALRYLREKEKCDIVIALTHMGLTGEEKGHITSVDLAQWVPDIDLIIDGHSHTLMYEPVFVGTVPIVSANEWGKYVGTAAYEITDGSITSFTWKAEPINEKDVLTYPPDPDVTAMIEPYRIMADLLLKEVVAQAAGEFEAGDKLSRKKETALGIWLMTELCGMPGKFSGRIPILLLPMAAISALLFLRAMLQGKI